jgi:hypothetical protein
MFGIVLKLFAIAVGIVLAAYAAAHALRSARRLDRRIAEFKAEQEEAQQKGGPINPYAALAELYAEEARRNDEAVQRRAARSRQ